MPKPESIRWLPPKKPSKKEEKICPRCTRNGRLRVFLRRHRRDLFDEELQAELVKMYSGSSVGHSQVPPALLAMVTILRAADGVSDEGAANEAVFDLRGQMVLGCMGAEFAPFSQGVLVEFRRRMIEHDLNERLVAKSVELAKRTGGFGYEKLRVALDSAPLRGAGRVEDGFNLIGHALEVVVRCAAVVAERSPESLCESAQLRLVGRSSFGEALDIDRDDEDERARALGERLAEVGRLRTWCDDNLTQEQKDAAPLQEGLPRLERVISQDVEPAPKGSGMRIARGMAKERQIPIPDPSMRHGRRSRSTTIPGDKRFIAKDLDHGRILGVIVQPANPPEQKAPPTREKQVERFGTVSEFFIDRGSLASAWTAEHRAAGGRVMPIHEREELLQELAARKTTPKGRAALRPRVTVEHSLAHICNRQGRRARCIGIENNVFDLCRHAVVENRFAADRMERAAA